MTRRKKRSAQPATETPAPAMDLETALTIVDDDLPDGAYFAMLGELMDQDVADMDWDSVARFEDENG